MHRPLSSEGLRPYNDGDDVASLLAQTSELGGVTTNTIDSDNFAILAQTSELGGVTTISVIISDMMRLAQTSELGGVTTGVITRTAMP